MGELLRCGWTWRPSPRSCLVPALVSVKGQVEQGAGAAVGQTRNCQLRLHPYADNVDQGSAEVEPRFTQRLGEGNVDLTLMVPHFGDVTAHVRFSAVEVVLVTRSFENPFGAMTSLHRRALVVGKDSVDRPEDRPQLRSRAQLCAYIRVARSSSASWSVLWGLILKSRQICRWETWSTSTFLRISVNSFMLQCTLHPLLHVGSLKCQRAETGQSGAAVFRSSFTGPLLAAERPNRWPLTRSRNTS